MGNTVLVLPQGKGEGEKMSEQQIIETLATKVMGWKTLSFDDGDIFVEDDKGIWRTWRPLQNISDAWQVVEKLYIAVIPQSPNAPEDMRFHAFVEDEPFGPKIEAFAETAQKAICQVAMKLLLNTSVI